MGVPMSQLSLTIDGKKNRLRISKASMRILGLPAMVQLLYNPGEKVILIRAAKEVTPGGQELHVHISKPGGDYDIYSLSFVHKLIDNNPSILGEGSYRLYGKAVGREGLVMFPLSTIEKVMNA